MSKINYQKENIKTIERWIEEDGWKWGKPIDHETYLKAQEGNYDIVLTPIKSVPHSWLGDLKGKRVLGLASGGGQQMPILVALGGICTVFDLSELQLASEKLVADREGYNIEIVKGDMTKTLPFKDEEFDIIFSPVSYCYIEELEPLFRECYRILKKGGRFMFGADNAINYLTNDEGKIVNSFPFNPLKNKEQRKLLIEDDCGYQFSHTLEETLGIPLKIGFKLLDMYEDTNDEGRLFELNIPTYVALLFEK